MIDINGGGWLFETGILKPVHIYRGLKSDCISKIVAVNVNVDFRIIKEKV